MIRLEFDGIGVPDHLMTGDGATMECLSTVAALAAETERVTLFPKTINNELRHGPLLAKTAATLDALSDGRLKLGMGAGWKDDEARAYGYKWPAAPTRLRRMEETIEVSKRLWTGDHVSYEGSFFDLDDAICRPRPVQDPHPPVMVGGGGEEFTLRIAAKHADEWNFWGSPKTIEHKLDVLADHCETYDADVNDIDISWFTRCIVRETQGEIDMVLDDAPRFRDPDEEDPMSEYNNLIGTPTGIHEEVERYRAIGVDEVDVEFVYFPDTTGAEALSS